MKNSKFILSSILVCCMVVFCYSGIFGQGGIGEYPGAGVGFDSGCGYPNAGNSDPGVSDAGLTGFCPGNTFDVSFGPWTETATGFDITGFTLSNYDIDPETVYGIRLFYGPQDQCGTICLDAVLNLGQGQPCGTFGPQVDLSSFGYPVPALYGDDIFGADVIPYANMCPNTEYFAQYQFVSTTSDILTDPDGNFCALDDGTITNLGTMTTVQTLVAPGTRNSLTINAATFTPVDPVDCAAADVLFELTVDVTSGCVTDIGQISKGLEVELRGPIPCTDGVTNINISSGSIVSDPTACIVGVMGTSELPAQVPATDIQISLGSADDICAILACNPDAILELYARHTFCEADDINGDGTGVDEAVFPISLVDILAAYNDAGAMCCVQACDQFDSAILFGSTCNSVTYGVGFGANPDGTAVNGQTEDPANYTWTVNSNFPGTQADQFGFFDTTGDGNGDFIGNVVTFTADQLAQGCEREVWMTSLTVVCPDGTPAMADFGGGVLELTDFDVIDAFAVTSFLYPDAANFTLTEVAGGCDMAPMVTITAPDGTVCYTETGTAPVTPACDSGVTNSSPLDYDQTFGSSNDDGLVADMSCEGQYMGTVLADCAAVVCPTVCPDIASLAASATDVCTGDNITVTVTLSGATEGDETIEVNNTAPDAPNNPIPAGVTTLTYTIAAPANTGCASAPLSISVTTATCMDASPITDNSMAATVNVFPNAFTTAITDDGSTCGTPSIDLIAADGATVCETITGMACVLDGDATAYDFATSTALTGFPAACIPAGLSGTLTCSGCAVACPTVALTDAMPTICGGALATEFADWQAAVVAANPATDPDGTSTGIVYSSINDNTAPDGDVSGITGMNMTCDPTTQIVYAFLGCDTTLPADGTPDSFQLAGTFTLTINPVLTAMEIAGSDMTAGCSTYMAALFAADGTQCAGTEMTATCVDNGDALTIDFPADANACYAAQTVTAPNACAGCGMCAITPGMATAIACDNNGTPTDPSDDTFTFTITVNGNNPAVGASQTFNDDQGNTGIAYGTAVNYGSYPIAGGNITVNFTDADDPMCTGTMMAAAPATCSGESCGIMPNMATNIQCNDNGTPADPSDDTYTFDITVNGDNPAAGATNTFNDDQGNAGIAYGTLVSYGPYQIAGGNITVNFTDADDTACTGMMMATAPATCSGQMTSIDITDPCSCDAPVIIPGDCPANPYPFTGANPPANVDVDGDGFITNNGMDLVADVIEIVVSTPIAGETFTVAAAGTALNCDGTPVMAGDAMVETAPGSGVYQLVVYYPADGTGFGTMMFDADMGSPSAAITNPGGPYTPCVCEPCNGDIAGTIILADCDFTGTIVTIFDDTGAVVGTTMADMMGNYMLAGPFECGNYTVELTAVPPCYVNEDGDVGPRAFVIDGDDTPDGFDFGVTPANIPTVGEWGLIILGLLMSITAIVGIRQRREEEATAS